MTTAGWWALLGAYVTWGCVVASLRMAYIHSNNYKQEGVRIVVRYPSVLGIVAFWPAVLILWALIWGFQRADERSNEHNG